MDEHHGQYFDQARVEIHPWAGRPFSDRSYAVAMSADSAVSAGRLGVPMTTFIQGPMQQVHVPIFDAYNESYRQHHDGTPPPPVLTDLTFCHEDAGVAEEKARQHIAEYFLTCVHHYELGGHHFDEAKGYESYAESGQALREMGLEAVTDAFVEAQIWGTPEQILEKYEARLAEIGSFEPVFSMRYGAMSFEDAEASTRLLAAKVLPGLKQLDLAPAS
jgi:alkanesulfonate monooxygenase SsuD/methylene tetrahydromethanopterin reductase-like flavin-dependent oxidoreductase (luciferase family)